MAEGRTRTAYSVADALLFLANEASSRDDQEPHIVTVDTPAWRFDMLVGKGTSITGLNPHG